MPLMTTVTQAGSIGKTASDGGLSHPAARCGIRSNSRKTPAAMVIGRPARQSLIFLSMKIPPKRRPARLDMRGAATYNR